MAYDWLEVVLHQPLFDQRILGEGAPDLFRWGWHLPLGDARQC